MNSRLTLRTFAQTYGKWVVLFALPLAVNLVLWAGFVAPQKKQLETVRRTDAMYTLVPRVESLLKESRQAIVAWERSGVSGGDSSAALQALRRQADKYNVRLSELAASRGGRSGEAQSASPTVKVDATGRFSRLARWLSAVERQPGLQVESWSLVPDGDELRMTAEITAVLKES